MTSRRKLIPVLLVALLAAAALVAVQAGAAAKNVVVLGASDQTGVPACPDSPCQAVGKVTGFQTAIGKGFKKPFVVPFDGRISAWSIKLSAPNDTQKKFFDDFYGGPPSARIGVLKPIVKSPGHYKLVAQGPVQQLDSVLGKTTTFALKVPLKVRTGQIVALTIPTWAPAFNIGLDSSFTWRGSRKMGKCGTTGTQAEIEAQVKAGRPHTALGSERLYGCAYPTARLLYSATLVKGPQT